MVWAGGDLKYHVLRIKFPPNPGSHDKAKYCSSVEHVSGCILLEHQTWVQEKAAHIILQVTWVSLSVYASHLLLQLFGSCYCLPEVVQLILRNYQNCIPHLHVPLLTGMAVVHTGEWKSPGPEPGTSGKLLLDFTSGLWQNSIHSLVRACTLRVAYTTSQIK